MVIVILGIIEKRDPEIAALVWPKTLQEFVERWPEQKRLFKDLPRPLTVEQKRALRGSYYHLKPAGQLLDELGGEAFLQRFGGNSVRQMRKAAAAEIKQRKKCGENREVVIGDAEDTGNEDPEVVAFVKPTTPKDFVKRWLEQKRLFEDLPRPLSREQRIILYDAYYPFVAVGRLLEELGEEAFLEKFGGGTVDRMREAAKAEIEQRMIAKKDRSMIGAVEDARNGGPSIVKFVRPRSPEDFVKRWPEQKRLFASLPRPLTPEQKRALKHGYYDFVTTGQLLDELGKEAFLQRFGGSPIGQMLRDARVEMEQRRAGVRNVEVGGPVPGVTAFVRPESVMEFVELWSEQKRLYQNLQRPITLEQGRAIRNNYYRFAAAGQLLEELGREVFLQKFKGSTVTGMQQAIMIEIGQGKVNKGQRRQIESESFRTGHGFLTREMCIVRSVADSESPGLEVAATMSSGGIAPTSIVNDPIGVWQVGSRIIPRASSHDNIMVNSGVASQTGKIVLDLTKDSAVRQSERDQTGELRASAPVLSVLDVECAFDTASLQMGANDALVERAQVAEAHHQAKETDQEVAAQLQVGELHSPDNFDVILAPATSVPDGESALNGISPCLPLEEFLAKYGGLEETEGATIYEHEEWGRANGATFDEFDEWGGRGGVTLYEHDEQEGTDDVTLYEHDEWEELYQSPPYEWQSDEEESQRLALVLELEQCCAPASEGIGIGQSEARQDQVMELHFPDSPHHADSVQTVSAADIESLLADASCGADVGAFVIFQSPKDFVERWSEQRLFFGKVPYCRSSRLTHMLECTYYRFLAAARLLKELGEEAFLARFGGGTVEQMQQDTMAEIKQRWADMRDLGVAVGVGTAEVGERVPGMAAFVRPKSVLEFVERWPEQKRLIASLQRPLSPEQIRILESVHYRYAAAGHLLEKLGKRDFLQRFGGSSVNQMQKATRVEMKQKGAVEEDCKGIADFEAPGIVGITRSKMLKDFMECQPEQKRRFVSPPHPWTNVQDPKSDGACCPSTAARQLVAALGEEAFLQTYGGGSVCRMKKDTKAVMRRRKSDEADGNVAETVEEIVIVKVPDRVQFAEPETPKDFEEPWPEQNRPFESPPHGNQSLEQEHALQKVYHAFTAAESRAEELEKEEFLETFEEDIAAQIKNGTDAEVGRQRMIDEEPMVTVNMEELMITENFEESMMAENVEQSMMTENVEEPIVAEIVKGAAEEMLGVVVFTRPKTAKEFVKLWPEQKRLFERLPPTQTLEQKRMLATNFLPFTVAGRRLEKFGEEAFLRKFRKRFVNQIHEATAAEMKQKAAEEDQNVVEPVQNAGNSNSIVRFTRSKTPKEFVERWPEQKRLFESIPRPFSPEQCRHLQCTHYIFTAAGQLLDELGEEMFLQKFGSGSVQKMMKATRAEIKQRRTAERDRKAAEAAKDMGSGGSGIVRFVKPKTPKDFVERWAEQQRLFESLSHPLVPEQTRVLRDTYYRFAAAGKLLEELGVEAFMQRFGGGTVTRMRKDTITEMKQRRAAEKGSRQQTTKSIKAKEKSKVGSTSAKDRKKFARRSKRKESE